MTSRHLLRLFGGAIDALRIYIGVMGSNNTRMVSDKCKYFSDAKIHGVVCSNNRRMINVMILLVLG